MSVTSVNPADLTSYLGAAGTARDEVVVAFNDLVSLAQAVSSACQYRQPSMPGFNGLPVLLDQYARTDAFVTIVHDAVVEADRIGADPAAVDAAIAARLDRVGIGANPGPMALEAMQMMGMPPTSGFVDDPICAANGNFVHGEVDLGLPGFARLLSVARIYNSVAGDLDGAFGPGWTSLLDVHLHAGGGHGDEATVVRVRLHDGADAVFRRGPDGDYADDVRRPLSLTRTDGGWLMADGPTGWWRFDADGALVERGDGVAVVAIERTADEVRCAEARSGRWVRFSLEGGRVRSVESSDGRRCSYRYVGGHLVQARRAIGEVRYRIADGRIASVIDADGVVLCRNVFDGGGRVLSQVNEHGRETRYDYGDLGVTTITDPQGGPRNVMVHDRRGNLTAVIEGSGRSMRLEYGADARGHDHVVRRIDRDGAVTGFAHDERGNLVERRDPDGRTHTWEWDDRSRLVAEVDRAGVATRYEYDGAGRVPVVIVHHDGTRITAAYDERELPSSVTDADGVTTAFEWDDDGQLVAVVDGLGARTTFAYDAAGQVVGARNPSGVFAELTTDRAGRVVASTTADGTERFSLTAAGRITGSSMLGGVSFTAAYDATGQVRTLTDAVGASVTFERDRFANVTAVVAPDGATYRQEYDDVGRLVAAIDAAGVATTAEHDAEGRQIATVDATGRRWERRVDALGRTVEIVGPDGATSRRSLHPNGELASTVDATGATWVHEIDGHGRTTALIDPLGRRTTYTYTDAGRLSVVRLPSGAETRARYDAAGRVVAVEGPDGTVTDLVRRADGAVTAVQAPTGTVRIEIDPSGRVRGATDGIAGYVVEWVQGQVASVAVDPAGTVATRFEHDPRALLARATDPAGVVTDLVHDLRGRLTAAVTGDATTTFGFDAAGRPARITDPYGATTTFERDAAGRVAAVVFGDGGRIDHVRDRVGAVERTLGADGSELVRWAFDPVGRFTEAATPAATTHIGRDPLGRPVQVDVEVAGDPQGWSGSRRYDWDVDGRLASVVDGDGWGYRIERRPDGLPERYRTTDGVTIGRPDLSALTASRRDRAGRVAVDAEGRVYRYDDAGRLAECVLPAGTRTTYDYDGAGRLATEETDGRTTSYRYGRAGELVARTLPDGTDITYRYDARGRRTGETSSDGSTVAYSWDDLDNLLAVERRSPDREAVDRIDYDGFGRPVAIGDHRVAWDLGGTGAVARIDDDRFLWSGRAHLRVDPDRGITRDAAGDRSSWSVGRTDDPWGVDGGEGVRLGFRGSLTLDGLVFLGARVYDPATRCFLTRDPLAPVVGALDLASPYCYSRNDPVNLADPTGGRPLSDEEYDAIKESMEKGTFEKAWDAIKEDPWGTLAMVGVVALGVGLCFVPGGQVIGAGILIGAGMAAGAGLATGTFNPRSVVIGGVVGGVTGGVGAGASMTTTVLVGAGASAGGNVADQMWVRGRGLDEINPTEVLVSGAIGGVTAGGAKYIFGRAPTVAEAADAPAISNTNPVVFNAPKAGATPAQLQQIRDYVSGSNAALLDDALSPTGRVSTSGPLRVDASNAAAAERAANPGAYAPGQHVGHVPDTTWTGTPQPHSWLPLDESINTSLGSQAAQYPVGYKPSGFYFIDDYVSEFGTLPPPRR